MEFMLVFLFCSLSVSIRKHPFVFSSQGFFSLSSFLAVCLMEVWGPLSIASHLLQVEFITVQ